MSRQNAIHFLRDVDRLEKLRHELYLCEGREALFDHLAESGYPFTGAEFEEVIDHLHVSCATEAEADQLMTRATWFRMVAANA